MNNNLTIMMGMLGQNIPQFKSNPTPINPVKVGDRNKKCQGCGHKNKKCTCGLYNSSLKKNKD